MFFLEFSFGDHAQSCGHSSSGSPNFKIQERRLNSERIWKDAVEYSSLDIAMEQCLFQNEEWLSSENSQLSSGIVKLDENEVSGEHSHADTSSCSNCISSVIAFPASTLDNKCIGEKYEGTAQSCGMFSCLEEREHCSNEKRTRNNEACKKFRRARKTRHEQLYIMEERMMKENSILKSRIGALEEEIEKWKEFLSNQN